jgi:hypothetical protein
MTKNNTEYRVTQLEKNYDEVCEKLDKVLTNHLPHIQNEIVELKGEIKALADRVTVGVGINVLLIVGSVLGIVLLLK